MGDLKAKVIKPFKDRETNAYCLIGEVVERSAARIKELKAAGYVVPLTNSLRSRRSNRK